MRIEVKGVIGLKKNFDLELDDFCVIFGFNEEGKTSIATAVRACLTRNSNPAGLAVPMMKHYVNDDNSDGWAMFKVDSKNFVMWNASQKSIREVGDATPSINSGALAGIDFCALGGKGHTDYWESVLGIGTDEELLRADMLPLLNDWREGDADLAEADMQGIIELVTADGFELAEKSFRTKARRLKAEWDSNAACVGESRSWGRAIGRDWLPKGWTPEIQHQPVAAILRKQKEVKAQIDKLNRTEVRVEFNQEEVAEQEHKLEALKEKKSMAVQEEGEMTAAFKSAEKKWNEISRRTRELEDLAKKARQMFTQTINQKQLECPKCGQVLKLGKTGKLIKGKSGPTKAEIQKYKDNAAQTRVLADDAGTQAKEFYTVFQSAKQDMGAATKFVEKLMSQIEFIQDWLEKSKSASRDGADSAEIQKQIDVLTDEAEQLGKWSGLITAKNRADELNRTILLNENIAYRLSAKGFRAEQMQKGVVKLNKVATKICTEMRWPALHVDKDLSLSWGGRPVQLASVSARWRVNAILACAVSWISKSELLMFDGGDILDSPNYEKFVNYLQKKMVGKLGKTIIWIATEQLHHRQVFDHNETPIHRIF